MTEALTIERLKELYSYDPATGVFTRLSARNNTKPGPVKTRPNEEGYLRLYIDGNRYKQHRLAVFYMTGAWPIGEVDHKSGDRAANAISGLRDVGGKENSQNRKRANKNSSTGLLGAYIRKSKADGSPVSYSSAICVDGKQINLGSHKTAEAAHAAFIEAKRRLHPGNTL